MNKMSTREPDPLISKLKLMEEEEIGLLLDELSAVKSPMTVGFLNQHGYNIAQRHAPTYDSFSRLDYLLRDGIGIKLACQLNGLEPKANLNGSDFIPRLIDHFLSKEQANYQFFAMGTAEPWLSKGSKKLFQGRPFYAIDGFKAIDDYVAFYRDHHVPGTFPVIVLAMGMPKQEEVARRLQREIGVPALLICGGAILDFKAERFPRAPALFRKTGLEWLFRLAMEPQRLFKRYAVGIPLFFYYLSRNSTTARSNLAEGVRR